MKLLVIILCLLSERYLVHAASHYRFAWFGNYVAWLNKNLSDKLGLMSHSYFALAVVVLPPVLITALVLYLFDTTLFGFIGLLLNILIFYYCLGPNNSFYPVSEKKEGESEEVEAGAYLAKVNSQLFAVIFWFIVAGPLGALVYRLIYLSKDQEQTRASAELIASGLDWITSRLTLLLYMLVGNFQRGFQYYSKMFFSSPANNETLLREGGLLVAHTEGEEVVTLPYAQTLVEHALIVYLVFLAFFTLVAWL